MANKPATTKPATAKVTLATVPAPKQAAPAAAAPAAAAPAAAAPAPQAFAGFTHPVTAGQVQAFINTQCGGNPAMCGIAPLANMVQGQGVPFLRNATGARAAIVNALLWGYANGHTGPVNLAGVYAHFKARKLATQGWADLLALLNGGFSASSKVWGTPFAQLVVLPPPAPATPPASTPSA